MIEEIGVVTAVGNGRISVQTQIKSTCSACVAESDCGTGVVAKAFAPKTDELTLECSQPVEVGQSVKLGIPESSVLSASALVYLVPLLVLLATALAGPTLVASFGLTSELWIVLLCAASTTGCFMLIRRWLGRSDNTQYQPQLLKVLPHPKDVISTRTL